MKIIEAIRRKLHFCRRDTRSEEEAAAIASESVNKAAARQRERIRNRKGPKRNNTLRMFSVALAAMLTVSLVIPGTLTVSATNPDFNDFLENEWKESMELDYLTMHLAVKDYKSLGLTKPEVTLGDISYEQIEKEVNDAKNSLEKLRAFDLESLDDTQQHDYLAYEDYLECIIGMEQYPEMIEMFRPINGMFTQIKEVFEDFKMHSEEDVEDYMTLLADFPRYIDQMLDLTSQQAAKGYLMSDDSVDEAVEEINDFVSAGEGNELIAVFNNNMDEIDWLADDAKEEYKTRNHDIVINSIIPAYEKAGKALTGLKGSRKWGSPVCEYPEGKDYYTWLAKYNCGTDETLDEKFDFLTASIKETLAYYRNVLRANPSLEEPATIEGLESLDDVIGHLQDNMGGFPAGPKVNYKLSYLDESVAQDAMAYYIQSPVDDVTENVIRVNKDSVKDINTLYFTLAHEGYPGHLYQMTWYQNSGAAKLRHDITTLGYQEGWANYVERIMLQRSGLDEASVEMIACEEFLGYMVNAASDIAANGLGYTVKDLSKWFGEIGLDGSYAKDYYDFSIAYPGVLLPYGYGEAKFWDLNGRARAALGEDFDLEEYHLQLLTNGPRQFEIVEQDLKAYVESKGKTLPDEVKMFEDEKITAGKEQTQTKSSGYWLITVVFGAAALVIFGALFIILGRRHKRPVEPARAKDIYFPDEPESSAVEGDSFESEVLTEESNYELNDTEPDTTKEAGSDQFDQYE